MKRSHIIPKFAIEWLKATSATGYIRRPVDPNIRLQDGPTLPVLCQGCEAIISKSEKAFAEDIWTPIAEGYTGPFAIDDIHRRFAISLAWRTVIAQTRFGQAAPAAEARLKMHRASVERAADDWGQYLLGRRVDPGPYESHVFLLDEIAESSEELGDRRMHSYFLRGIDVSLALGTSRVLAFTLLPRMALWTLIDPPTGEQNRATRLFKHDVITTPQELHDAYVGQFIVDRARLVGKPMGLSARQEERITRSMLANPVRAWESESHRAARADARLTTKSEEE